MKPETTQPVVVIRKKENTTPDVIKDLVQKVMAGTAPAEPLESIFADHCGDKKTFTTIEQAIEKLRVALVNHFAITQNIVDTVKDGLYALAKLKTSVKTDRELPNHLSLVANYEAPLKSVSVNHMAAIARGQKIKVIGVDLIVDDDLILAELAKMAPQNAGPISFLVQNAITDAYHLKIKEAAFNSIRGHLLNDAQDVQIKFFAANLFTQLLQPGLGSERVMAVNATDTTAFAVGTDETGAPLDDGGTVSLANADEAKTALAALIAKYQPKALVIRQGKASKVLYPILRAALATLETPLPLTAIPIDELILKQKAGVKPVKVKAGDEAPAADTSLLKEVAQGLAQKIRNPFLWLKSFQPLALAVGPFQQDVDQDKLLAKLNETFAQVESIFTKYPPRPLRLVALDKNILSATDFAVGLELKGRVTTVMSYGVFVDVGYYQDVLAHRSDLPKEISKNFMTIFKPGMLVKIKIVRLEAGERLAVTIMPLEVREAREERPEGERREQRPEHRGERREFRPDNRAPRPQGDRPRHDGPRPHDQHRPHNNGPRGKGPQDKGRGFKFGTLGDQLKGLLEK